MKFRAVLLLFSLCTISNGLIAARKKSKKYRWLKIALTDYRSPLAQYYGNEHVEEEQQEVIMRRQTRGLINSFECNIQ